jgi:hypothetical protein
MAIVQRMNIITPLFHQSEVQATKTFKTPETSTNNISGSYSHLFHSRAGCASCMSGCCLQAGQHSSSAAIQQCSTCSAAFFGALPLQSECECNILRCTPLAASTAQAHHFISCPCILWQSMSHSVHNSDSAMSPSPHFHWQHTKLRQSVLCCAVSSACSCCCQ